MSSELYNQLVARLPDSSRWAPDFLSSALLLDLETTGFDYRTSRINLVGVQPVIDGEVVEDNGVDLYIQTPYDPVIWKAVYSAKHPFGPSFNRIMDENGGLSLEQQRAIDANAGSIYGLPERMLPRELYSIKDRYDRPAFLTASDVTGITPEITMTRGVERERALASVYTLICDAMEHGRPLVGHSLVGFDLPFLMYELKTYLGVELKVDQDMVFDTGMLVKASQAGVTPYPGETLFKFFRRTNEVRARVKWALDKHCVAKYGLDTKYGVDTSRQHGSAAYDCWVTACLLKELAKGTQ